MLLLPAMTSGMPQINTVYNYDALAGLKAMPDKCVDIVVTSPPYNLKRKNKQTLSGMMKGRSTSQFVLDGRYDTYDDDMPELEYQQWLRDVITKCLRVSKGLVWLNHKMRFVEGEGIHPLRFLPFPVWSEVIWNRRGSITLNARKFAPSHEYLFGFGKPHYWDDKSNTLLTVWDITRGSSNDDSEHPCPYPEALVRPLITSSCPVGGVVLDPFIGSGTTGRVAITTNRKYIGIDISSRYCNVARKRNAHPYTADIFGNYELEVATL